MRKQFALRGGRARTVGAALLTTSMITAAAPLVVAASAQNTPVSISIKDATLRYGQALLVTGRASRDYAGRSAVVEFQPAGSVSWRPLRSARIAAGGGFRVAVPVHASGAVRARVAPAGIALRAAATSAGGDQTTAHAVSVSAGFVTLVRRLDVLRGQRAGLHGTLRPARAGRLVLLQRRVNGRWRNFGHDRTDRRGRYAISFRAPRTGSVGVRLAFAGDAVNAGTTRAAGDLNVYRRGLASWYADGGAVACGHHSVTGYGVAHRSLPCGTIVTVRYHGRSVRAQVIDRGPFVGGREWDLGGSTAHALRFDGVGEVWTTR